MPPLDALSTMGSLASCATSAASVSQFWLCDLGTSSTAALVSGSRQTTSTASYQAALRPTEWRLWRLPFVPAPSPFPPALRANRLAERLLLRQLTPAQRQSYTRLGFFELTVGQRRYLLRRCIVSNVHLLDAEGAIVRTYCAHPLEALPVADVLLAQKLLLETDEAAFLRIANAR